MDAAPARLLVVEHEDWAGPGRLVDTFRDNGIELDACRPYKGDTVPDDAAAAGYDGVLVLGGSMAAWEDDVAAWLPATRAMMRTAVDAGTPVLGICLGAQLLALATGGAVTRGDRGLEVGVRTMTTTPAAADDPFMGRVVRAVGPTVTSVQWHVDAVTELPPGATLLAGNDRYPHQAYRVGRRAWGVQYHPEVTRSDWGAWVEGGVSDLPAHGHDPDALTAGVDAAEADLAAGAEAHAEAFAAVVRAARHARALADGGTAATP